MRVSSRWIVILTSMLLIQDETAFNSMATRPFVNDDVDFRSQTDEGCISCGIIEKLNPEKFVAPVTDSGHGPCLSETHKHTHTPTHIQYIHMSHQTLLAPQLFCK